VSRESVSSPFAFLTGGQALSKGDKELLDRGIDIGWGGVSGDRNGIDRGPCRDLLEQLLLVGSELPV
jgi:hypothetical protein